MGLGIDDDRLYDICITMPLNRQPPNSLTRRQVRNTERATTPTSVVPIDQHTLPRSHRQHYPFWNHGRQGSNTQMLRLVGPRCDRGPLTGFTHYDILPPVDIAYLEQPHVFRMDSFPHPHGCIRLMEGHLDTLSRC